MITHVAIRNQHITIALPKPNRHSDCFDYAMKIGIDIDAIRLGFAADDQGFLTSSGKFLNRRQAARHVKRYRQPTLEKVKHVITSESLW